ncbi:hypothetical protein R1sor_008586 [Riccia sorocarpa]|uniref:Reverse transcriptase domain-containing protein n=1 Tax=Riccia sorocarpa TaxID=122646 RepID=A0ABD3HTU0_9MARC
MRLAVGTYYVRGLCSRMARTKLRNVITSIRPPLDILALQEHKIRDRNIDFLTSAIWPNASMFNLTAEDGLQADPANIYTQLKLEEARTQLAAWEADKARWIQSLLDRKWEDEEERVNLQKDFSSEELHVAAKLLGRNKSPGPDGVPLEFFLALWETVSPLLLRATAEGLQQGQILPFFNEGVIILLQKDGDQTMIQNKRPITLPNVVYKIWAKALQLRLTPVLQRLISWEQNAFISGRQLHTTVLLCNEVVYEAKKNNIDSVLLKIDFKKAFDTLRWDFLYAAMEKMEFGHFFISLVKTLNSTASSAISINNACSSPFQISRPVRQGCPLSPLLFTIAIQVLTDTINGWIQMQMLKGIELTSINTHYCQGYFADDAHFLLAADKQNLLNAKSLLQTFGQASGLTVQWAKSKARWISSIIPRPLWTGDLDWVWSTDQDADKFLGFQFSDGLDA